MLARIRCVPRAQAQQAAQHHRHVGAENPSVVVAFIDHQVPQVAQEHRPPGVVAHHRQVDHVRIGEDPAGPLAGESAHFGGAVAVIGGRGDVGEPGNGGREFGDGTQLVVSERLRGRQIQRAGARILLQRRQYRQLVGHRLARRRPGTEHHVASAVSEVGRGALVRPQHLDATIAEGTHHIWVGPGRPALRAGLSRRQVGDVAYRMLVDRGALDRAGEQRAAEVGHRIRPSACCCFRHRSPPKTTSYRRLGTGRGPPQRMSYVNCSLRDGAETVAAGRNVIDYSRSQLLCRCPHTRRNDVAIAVPARVVGRV